MSPPDAPDITVVVVLYNMTPLASAALAGLASSLGRHAGRFAVEVHDNSPQPGAGREGLALDLAIEAHHPGNPGLAVPYASALESAERRGSAWLMLLDQDTAVTAEYVEEVITTIDALRATNKVGVIAPRLMAGDLALSPHKPLRLRPRALGGPGLYPPSSAYAYLNSGAVLSVAALRAVGGFPQEFPLDFLDHEVSARLKAAGYWLVLMNCRLEHQLSVLHMPSVPPQRLQSIFRAEEAYFFGQGRRSEALWLLLRRTARAVLLAMRVHQSPHRQAELDAAYIAVRMMVRRSGPSRRSEEEHVGDVR
jgi:GT2 family glycosyltransferase